MMDSLLTTSGVDDLSPASQATPVISEIDRLKEPHTEQEPLSRDTFDAMRQHRWLRRASISGSLPRTIWGTMYLALVIATPAALSTALLTLFSPVSLAVETVVWASALVVLSDPCLIVVQRFFQFLSVRNPASRMVDSSNAVAVAVSCIPSDIAGVKRVLVACDEIAAGVDRANTVVVVLADLPDASCATLTTDEPLIDALKEGITTRNVNRATTSPSFVLLGRNRSWSEVEKSWICLGRKRRKVFDLARVIAGNQCPFSWHAGAVDRLSTIEYVLTLDEDSRLTPGCLDALVAAAMAHDAVTTHHPNGDVAAGHGIFVPRIMLRTKADGHPMDGLYRHANDAGDRHVITLDGVRYVQMHSRSQCIVAPAGGGPARDLHHDLFGLCLYTGKALFHPRTFLLALADKLPDDRILSHDILEGAFLRPAYVDGAILTEEDPSSQAAKFQRSHRWMRGDWQNLLHQIRAKPAKDPQSRAFLYLTLVDQARRNLVDPASLGLLIIAALIAPGARGLMGLAIIALAPLVAELVGSAVDGLERLTGRTSPQSLLPSLRSRAIGSWRRLVQLPSLGIRAVVAVDAMMLAVTRWLTDDRLLEWSASSGRVGRRSRIHTLASVSACVFITSGIGLVFVAPFAGLVLLVLAVNPLIQWCTADD